MATSPAPLPDEQATADETTQRPALHLVSGVDDIDVPEGTEPAPPLAYRINATIADLATKLPGVWSERLPSFAETVEYIQVGDWTTSNAARTANLLAFLLLCLPLGALAAGLLWVSRKTSRTAITAVLFLLLAYAMS